jgi:tRNA pseudouridine38-40 synthase
MPHWKLTLAYDGTPYNGWQIQPNLPTVQGTLAHAIHHITGESTLPQGSGRTDTGVHALAQVATVTLTTPIPGPNLHRALNRILPPSIRVLSVEQVPADFHARHSARRKTYEYRILPGNQICSPMLAPYVWAFQRPLDLATLQQAATYVIGTHDFTSFAATDPALTDRIQANENAGAPQPALNEVEKPALSLPKNPDSRTWVIDPEKNCAISTEAEDSLTVRSEVEKPALSLPKNPDSRTWVIDRAKNCVISTEAEDSLTVRSEVERPPHFAHAPTNASVAAITTEPPYISTTNIRTIHHSTWHQQEDLFIYRVTGSGFLHHMVRNLVGTFVQTSTGHIPVDSIPEILAARNRGAAGFTAPARGLFLVEVEY